MHDVELSVSVFKAVWMAYYKSWLHPTAVQNNTLISHDLTQNTLNICLFF